MLRVSGWRFQVTSLARRPSQQCKEEVVVEMEFDEKRQ